MVLRTDPGKDLLAAALYRSYWGRPFKGPAEMNGFRRGVYGAAEDQEDLEGPLDIEKFAEAVYRRLYRDPWSGPPGKNPLVRSFKQAQGDLEATMKSNFGYE
jgi:hypothetical protein